jgi:hypothetical protein
MSRKGTMGISILVVVFMLACSDPTLWELIAERQHQRDIARDLAGPRATETAAATQTHDMGDLVKVADLTIELNGVQFRRGFIVAEFTVGNLGKRDVAISPHDFSALDESGYSLLHYESTLPECCGYFADDTVVGAGESASGKVCWGAPWLASGLEGTERIH